MTREEIGKKIQAFTAQNRERIIRFMRDIVAIPSMENQIGPVCNRIAEECNSLGVDEVRFDKMGNLIARVGEGPVKVVFDSHVDTVGIGDPGAWQWDPFKGKVENGILFGRGACDEKCSTPGMVYALRALKDLGLGKDFTFYFFANMEEWCDGLAPNVFVEVEKIRPDFVVVGEPTKMKVYRGHRGRLEIKGVTKGRSCHAANPQLGENAIYKMTKFIQSLEALNPKIKSDPFLGKGTVVVSKIECQTPSINAVPDECTITIDRRVTFGETKDEVLEQIRSLPGAEIVDINEMFYDDPSYTGFVYQVDKYFPAWALGEEHPLVAAGQAARRELWGKKEETGRWDFSTNATYWAGKAGIATIGFAPGDEIYAHTTLDQVPLEDVAQATSFYAYLPVILKERLAEAKR